MGPQPLSVTMCYGILKDIVKWSMKTFVNKIDLVFDIRTAFVSLEYLSSIITLSNVHSKCAAKDLDRQSRQSFVVPLQGTVEVVHV